MNQILAVLKAFSLLLSEKIRPRSREVMAFMLVFVQYDHNYGQKLDKFRLE